MIFNILFFLILFSSSAYAFDINSFAGQIQQKNTPEQWIQKNQIPNYDESFLQRGQYSSYENQDFAQRMQNLAAQMLQSQYTYTCSIIRKVEDKTLYKCNADGSIYPTMELCQSNCFTAYNCTQPPCPQNSFCSAFQVCPLGDYPCVNNSCTQTGTCTSQQVQITQYQCPVNGQIYSDLNQCNSACLQTAQCSASYGDITWSPPRGPCGNPISTYDDFRHGPQVVCDYLWPGSVAVSASCYPSECSHRCDMRHNGRWYCNTFCPDQKWCYHCGIASITCRGFVGYTCPLGNYPCTGSPPSCTAGQSCVTHSSTVTKWQCSLNGVQYDTQDQCTNSCYKTAFCNTNYKCTFENSVYPDLATCQQNCTFYVCPETGETFFSQESCQNACPSFICSHDNQKYSTMYDCQTACKEAGSCVKQ